VYQFDAHELSRFAKELPEVGRRVIDKGIADFNAKMRAVFDDERDKPTDEVLPVVRQRLTNNGFLDLDDEGFLAIAECISKGKIPSIARDTNGSMTLTKGDQ
jgi:hypothetical protein